MDITKQLGAWGSVVVKTPRYKSEGLRIDSRCHRGFFRGIRQFHVPSKNEYRDTPGGKGGRCVRLTTYHLHVPIVEKSGGLNLLEPCGPVQACNGTALPFITKQLITMAIKFTQYDYKLCISFK
jgi:hypothetical protein